MSAERMGARAGRAMDRAGRAMSQESTTPNLVERVRLLVAAANRREADAFLSSCAPNVVADFSQRGMGTFEGSAAAAEWLAEERG